MHITNPPNGGLDAYYVALESTRDKVAATFAALVYLIWPRVLSQVQFVWLIRERPHDVWALNTRFLDAYSGLNTHENWIFTRIQP